jgi:Putative prokaryotic signal transducing protein
MRELLITTDPVLLGYAQVLLADQGIEALIFDRHISAMEGSIGAFPCRLLVRGDDWPRARRILEDADLGQWLERDKAV